MFSGGQDSATCLAWALDRFAWVETVGFDYGQRHRVELSARGHVRDEIAAAYPDWAQRLGPDHRVDLTGFGAIADTALTVERAFEIGADGLPNTFVPGRNIVFSVAAGALAYRRGLDRLVGGMCQTDASGYPDCRRAAVDAMEAALVAGMDRATPIDTPLMDLTKAQTWALAQALGGAHLVDLIVEHSHTCYAGERGARHPWGYGCGACPACQLRAAGWRDFRGAEVETP